MEVHSGILTVKIPSLLKTKMYSNSWCILYNARGIFCPRIDIYENKSQVGHISCKKTIYIEEATWKKTESFEPVFSFEVKHHKQYIFVAASNSELLLWTLILCCVSKDLFDTQPVTNIGGLDKMNASDLNDKGEEIMMQDNDLYSSSNELSTFVVTADQSSACLQHGFTGPYKLRIGSGVVQLLQHDTEKEVTCWTLHNLKKFGHSSHLYYLEVGSRSKTGSGRFSFFTTEGLKITQRLNDETLQFKARNLMLEDASQTKVIPAIVKSCTQQSLVRPKPPPPSTKPKSLSVGSSSHTTDQRHYEESFVSEHRLSKKGTPPFGVPVLVSLRAQASNPRVTDIVGLHRENEINKRDSLKDFGLDVKQFMLSRSVSSQSSESSSRKDLKKAQKEFKKEQKKRAEEEKKERKRQEEEKKKEQKRRQEEEKKMKKEQKKDKQKVTKTLSEVSQSASVKNSSAHYEYTEADNMINNSNEPYNIDNANSEKIYSEPWGPLINVPLPPFAEDNEVVYSQPERKPSGKEKNIEPRDIVHTEYYEECQIDESHEGTPAGSPLKWEQEEGESNSDLYSHLNEKPMQDNIYGMASASVPVISSNWKQEEGESNSDLYSHINEKPILGNIYGMASASDQISVPDDENPYEETNIHT